MKSKFYIASLTLLLLTAKALAEYHTLTEPSVAFPNAFPAAARTNIVAALRRPVCRAPVRGCGRAPGSHSPGIQEGGLGGGANADALGPETDPPTPCAVGECHITGSLG